MPAYPVIKPSFEASFLDCNPGLAREFRGWLFYEPMLFGARHTWWGDGGPRERPHEGIDLSLYRDGPGRCRRLPHGCRIPAILNGTVVSRVDDFLGQSLFIRHDWGDGKGRRLYVGYGHMVPLAVWVPGARINAGEVVGTIVDPQMNKKTIPPHLHISVAWLPDPFPSDRLDWNMLVSEKEIVLLDPLKVLHLEYEVVPWEKRP